MSRVRLSWRSAILKKVLKFLDDGDFEEKGDAVLFGVEEYDLGSDESSRAAREIKSWHKQDVGRRIANRKTSTKSDFPTGAADKKIAKRLRDLVPEIEIPRDMELGVAEKLRELLPEPSEVEALDSKYAHELVDRLAKVVTRAARLPGMNVAVPPDIGVQKAFEEAHSCYLYGFFMAAAVLCRAVLERALVERLDPDEKLRLKIQPGQSYMEHLLDSAIDGGIVLGDSKRRYLQVRDAGNDAVHSPRKFEKKWSNKVGELLGDTRDMVEKLYRAPVRD